VLVVRFWHHNHIDAADKQWLRQMDDVLNNREDKLPKIGMYNAGQKLLFFVLIASMCGLLLSGIVIWRAYFAFYFPIEVVRFAALLHAFSAFVLICSIIVHIYAAFWVKVPSAPWCAARSPTGGRASTIRAGLKKWFASQD
jgi:formate dehydrogenase subunit gamma